MPTHAGNGPLYSGCVINRTLALGGWTTKRLHMLPDQATYSFLLGYGTMDTLSAHHIQQSLWRIGTFRPSIGCQHKAMRMMAR